ncbi:MAG: hypothetical protein IJP49_04670 [Bacteroidales bacterium]|nr:hypothetical protein [Bacteroidales bacterium]
MKRFTIISLLILYVIPSLCFGKNYDYPLKPGDEGWKELRTYNEMVQACQIPEDILQSLNAEEILQACLMHPFRINIILFPTLNEGFQSLLRSFPVFKRMLTNPEVKELAVIQQKQLYPLVNEDISFYLQSKILEAFLGSIDEQQMEYGIPISVLTPNGSIVSDTEQITDPEFTAYQRQQIAIEFSNTYPLATIVAPASVKYNCHAYAWHISEGGSNVWMGISTNPTSIYWTDGSYSSSNCRGKGLKVSYINGNHSAITTETTDYFISKWGNGPRVRHHKDYVPYVYSGLSYYIRNLPSQAYITGQFAQNAQWTTLNTANMVDRTTPITLHVYYPNAYLITWEKTSGGSDVQYGPQNNDGTLAGLTMNSEQSVSLRATAYTPCGTVQTEFYFFSTH